MPSETPKLRSRERGQALVEFALVLPILLYVVLGVFDLGWGIYAYTVVSSAAREGAHYATLDMTISRIQDQAVKRAIALNIPTSSVQVVCAHSGLSVSCSSDTAATGDTVTVTVPYTFNPLTLFFTPFTVTGKSTMTLE